MLSRCSARLSSLSTAKGCAPIPAVFDKALGVHVWDPQGKQYYDFSGISSSINQGHNHPRICDAMAKQVDTLANTPTVSYKSKHPKIQPTLGRKQTSSKLSLAEGSTAEVAYASKYPQIQPTLGRRTSPKMASDFAGPKQIQPTLGRQRNSLKASEDSGFSQYESPKKYPQIQATLGRKRNSPFLAHSANESTSVVEECFNARYPQIQPTLGRKQKSETLSSPSADLISSATGFECYSSMYPRVQPSLGRKKKNSFSHYADFITSITGYDRLVPANSGASAKEVAAKMARKWASMVKGVPQNEALIIGCEQNFHGCTSTLVTFSDDLEAWDKIEPFTPGLELVPYDDIAALEQVLEEKGDRIAAFFVEPIQGEAGVVVPKEGYLAKVHALCKKHNVLMIADEVQTGFGRTGKLFCSEYDGIQPDAIVMGKSLTGGLYPISGVVANGFSSVLQLPTHNSAFGGSPIANAVAIESLNVLLEEGMVANSFNLGNRFRSSMSEWAAGKESVVKEIRGKGLLNAIVVDEDFAGGQFANQWCSAMAQAGILAKPTHGNIIQFSPALVLTSSQLEECLDMIKKSYDVALAEL